MEGTRKQPRLLLKKYNISSVMVYRLTMLDKNAVGFVGPKLDSGERIVGSWDMPAG